MIDHIVIHIGTHKTGTTAIQSSFARARSQASGGVLYPRAGRAGVGHAGLTRELRRLDVPASEVPTHRELVSEARASGARTLVVSGEALTTRSARGVEWATALCAELDPREVTVLAYVRPQWEYIESSYSQRVKDGTTWSSFASYVDRSLEQRRFDYLRVFRPWREAFPEHLEVRPYASELLVGGDVVDDFWHAASLGSAPRERARPNRRPGARATEMLRALRATLAELRLDGLLPVREALKQSRRRIEAELPEDNRFAPLTDELVARVAERFAVSNAEFVDDYLGGLHLELFSPPPNLRPLTWSLEEATDDELRLFASLLEDALSEARGEAGLGSGRGAAPALPRGRRLAEPLRRRLRPPRARRSRGSG